MPDEKLRKWSETPWREVEEDELPTALMIGPEIVALTPIVVSDDGDGEEVIVWRTKTLGLPADTLNVIVPSVCGHHSCTSADNVAKFSLN